MVGLHACVFYFGIILLAQQEVITARLKFLNTSDRIIHSLQRPLVSNYGPFLNHKLTNLEEVEGPSLNIIQ